MREGRERGREGRVRKGKVVKRGKECSTFGLEGIDKTGGKDRDDGEIGLVWEVRTKPEPESAQSAGC